MFFLNWGGIIGGLSITCLTLSGSTLTLQTGTVNNYSNAAFGTDGQYTYQVIRVPVYYNLVLNADIAAG